MGKGYRPQRLGEEIRKIISDMLIRGELKDPGFRGLISINAVDVTRDASYATIYITVTGGSDEPAASAEEKQSVLAAFERSRGFIRTELARAIRIRHTPELLFRIDESLEYGIKMDQILSSLATPEAEGAEQEQEQEEK
ncbi:MAG TPA: 30S ribosome-binding factor RbfA [Clostridiales bacterium]|jgi:ribosome-binding factor A|nr:30S ribosome-binding factor RbfA [Clostridiales bacterium]